MKVDRKAVYEKFGNKCAYCGCDLKFENMQVDHFWPRALAHFQPELDNDRFGNLMPSCRKCNIHKTAYRPEAWRDELQRQIDMIKKSAQFDRCLRFGQIEITENPIVFWFEKWNSKSGMFQNGTNHITKL